MKTGPRSFSLLAASVLLLGVPAFAQQSPEAPVAASVQKRTFSQQDLDRLLAPIALYPDPLLAQILMASTYPLEVVEAARWAKANPKVNGAALESAMAKQSWDPAVKALTSVPQVLQQMNDNLDWMQKLGDAFLAQQQDVMNTVQSLRAKAAAAGNLKSTSQQVVKTQTQGSQTIYVVESTKPDVVYVPTYNPAVVYGNWWYPTPPYAVYPPSYAYPPGLAFATGVVVGAAIWGGCNWGWGHSNVDVNVNRYNSFNRTQINNSNWTHNVEHRRGVAYRDQSVARQYSRTGDAQAVRAREEFRGRAEAGRSELKGMDRGQVDDRMRDADQRSREGLRDRGEAGRADHRGGDRMQGGDRSGADRDRMSGGRADTGGRLEGGQRGSGLAERQGSGGFSGLGNGASTRQASERGNASRADFSGAGGRSGMGSGQRGGGQANFGGGGHRGGGGGGGGGRGGGRGR